MNTETLIQPSATMASRDVDLTRALTVTPRLLGYLHGED